MLTLIEIIFQNNRMKKKEKCSATSRWNDASTACIIYRATEEERKELTEKMVETMIGNVDKFHSDEEKSIKGLKDCQKDYLGE